MEMLSGLTMIENNDAHGELPLSESAAEQNARRRAPVLFDRSPAKVRKLEQPLASKQKRFQTK
ncbi:hypothetical protein [Bradyrhizobium sp. Leo170]|uniref:hypothetical protein n=1 Tax=Bradyrhizobium sp. Leo170 TaxID=1571199 RepID=UPI0006885A3A|nr:hypothetical protein [Bradyrhizobium sp. Leo170]TAI62322.1 hypothetical protein CWO89_30300 [Bradyrhizobium sp. Leo170]